MGTSAGQKTDTTVVQVEAVLTRLTESLQLSADVRKLVLTQAEQLLGQLDLLRTGRLGSAADMGEGGSSYAFSLVLEGEQPEVHLLWRAPATDSKDRVRASLQMQQRVQEVFGAPGSRFERIAPLFLREDSKSAPSVSYAARIWPARKPVEVMAYLDAQILGHLNAPALVEQALGILGFKGAWHAVSSAMSRGPELDEIRSFGLALSVDDLAPVEICICHHDATAVAIATAANVLSDTDSAHLVDFFRRSTGEHGASGAEAETRLSFVAGGGSKAVAATLRVPMQHRYQLETGALSALGGASAKIHASVSKVVGSASAVSLRSPGGRTECELSIETADAASARMPASSLNRASSVEPMVKEYEAQPLSLHPFFQRMSRQSVDVQHMWLMFSNIYAGLSQHFPRRLARVVLGVEDERIRSILTEQLHEELGSGDYTRTHRRLFVKLLDALAPWKPATLTPEMSVPGARLSDRLEAAYFDPQPYVGVGAAIVIELLGKQVDQFVADQFRRQQAVGMASLEWLTLHENLEIDHASESLDLASFVESDEDRAAAWRGGRSVYAAGWLFFDDMYRLCFEA
jgi:pyrroloquinoline quinone (PQQ) biosynthesis protein C